MVESKRCVSDTSHNLLCVTKLLAGRGPVFCMAETCPSVQATLHTTAMVGCL